MNIKSVIQRMSTARAEFHSTTNSVFGKFVVPPYIDSIDIANIDQSMAIVGGRGCGKTTYVRYFSHWTQFDPDRDFVSLESLRSVIFYWKPDTTYFRSLTKSWLTEKNSRIFFHALSGLSCFKEVVCFLENISIHFEEFELQLSSNLDFWRRVSRITGVEFHDLEAVKFWIEDSLFDVQMSINTNDVSDVVKIDAKAMFELLLPSLEAGCPLLKNTRYKIFVDEFENLAEYQQKIINGYRKHSFGLISWNVAHKRFAKVSNETDGDESIQHGNDYREYVLEDGFQGDDAENEKRFFLCELLILSLLDSGLKCSIENMSPEVLGDPERLSNRKDPNYRSSVIEVAQKILRKPSLRDLAKLAAEKKAVKNIVEKSLGNIEGLEKSFITSLILDRPDVAIATLAISTQKSFVPDDLVSYVNGGFSSGHPYNQRVQTYLNTAMLNLNARYSSYISIPLYAGLDRFFLMSMFNIRHFFDLCYNSFLLMDGKTEVDTVEGFPEVPLELMHQGAINSSVSIIKEIPTYAPLGLTLSGLVNRLGDIFQIWQKGDIQSEPERTHFYILHDFGDLPEKIKEVIDQAKCWRVLVEFPATKDKNSNSSSGYEYQLNPIYAPYFNISFRKIRRLEFTGERFLDICFSPSDKYESIRMEYIGQSKSSATSSVNVIQNGLFDDFA